MMAPLKRSVTLRQTGGLRHSQITVKNGREVAEMFLVYKILFKVPTQIRAVQYTNVCFGAKLWRVAQIWSSGRSTALQ
jgi:hypothetical protein